jgi:cob(I)alamin adenosyltransferase
MNTIFFTGAGDNGSSSVGRDTLEKSNILFHALGTLDELNTVTGLCRTYCQDYEIERCQPSISFDETLLRLQELLFIAQASVYRTAHYQSIDHSPVSGDSAIGITHEHVRFLESLITPIDSQLPPLRQFVIPGGHPVALYLDMARVVSRRTERIVVELSHLHPGTTSPELLAFLNRLSSVYFALARYANYLYHIPESHPRYQ